MAALAPVQNSPFTRLLDLDLTGPSWLARRRQTALESFQHEGLPDRRVEDWRFTNLAALRSLEFRAPESCDIGDELVSRHDFNPDGPLLVFVNGRFLPGRSRSDFPQGVTCSTFSAALEGEVPDLDRDLGTTFDLEGRPFAALNTALFGDGTFIDVPAGLNSELVIEVLHITVGEAEPVATHPRVLLRVGESASVDLLEVHVAEAEGPYLTNAVTECIAGPNTQVRRIKLVNEQKAGTHLATLSAQLARDASFTNLSFTIGGHLVRNTAIAVMGGEGSHSVLDGLYLVKGRAQIDNSTILDHAVPHCTSNEYYKGIITDQGRAVFNGAVIVRQDAQKTDSSQSNKNLLLSEDARVDTKPQLEIYADDVKCAHGATIGQLDADALFYLRSRGIPAQQARMMMVRAFAVEILERLPESSPLRSYLDSHIEDLVLGSGA